MSHIRQLRHREHNHLERYDHGKYKHIIQYVGHTGFYSGQVISGHGSKQNDRCHRKYRDKSRPSEGCEETCFFNTVHIVGKPCKSLCGRQCERIVTDEQFSFKGVDQHEEIGVKNATTNTHRIQKMITLEVFFLVIIALPPYVW